VPLNKRKKEVQIAGKGHNETLEIFNPLEKRRVATETVDGNVPGNGGTCHSHFCAFDMSAKLESILL
jgi:hypothetical protein